MIGEKNFLVLIRMNNIKNTKYGTLKRGTNSLRANAPAYIPNKTRKNMRTRNNVSNGNINNIVKNFNTISLTNTSQNMMSDLLKQFKALKAQFENAVAIDCEMVGVGYESALAHVAIVDFNGKEIYNKYVIPKGGIQSITDYRTQYSGIKPESLSHLDKSQYAFNKIKREVHNILRNKMIVGHGLENDFKVLEFIPDPKLVWDTTKIESYMSNDPRRPGFKRARKLKVLAKEFANNNIQLESREGHSPLEDARASMNLYRMSLNYPKVVYANMSK
jgi:hypothetical protein